jgi:hypothetical protein
MVSDDLQPGEDLEALIHSEQSNPEMIGEEENYEIKPEEDASLPFACYVCREPFTNPVVTLCQHYFCSDCVVNATKSNGKCPACTKPTFGVFNRAHKLIKKIQSTKGPNNTNPNNSSMVKNVKTSHKPMSSFKLVDEEPSDSTS